MNKKDMTLGDFIDHAAAAYSAEVRGHIYNEERQSGEPVEMPLYAQIPETLDEKIARIARAYSTYTGKEVETLEEANDFYIPGEDEDYEEDDYVIQEAVEERKKKEQAAAGSEGTHAEPPTKSSDGKKTDEADKA